MRTDTILTQAAGIVIYSVLALPGFVLAGEIRDVEISREGVLFGCVVQNDGNPIAGANVSLLYDRKPVAVVQTDGNGRFNVSGIRGGVHEIVVGRSRMPVRVWAHGTAPGSAVQVALLSIQTTVVRGQNAYSGHTFANSAPTQIYSGSPVYSASPVYGPNCAPVCAPTVPSTSQACSQCNVCEPCEPRNLAAVDLITLASIGTGVASLAVGIDNHQSLRAVLARQAAVASP